MFGISVITANYNHGKYLPECLDSLFNQTYVPEEVIVVDDASTDNSVEIVRSYQKKYPQLKLVQHTVNQGVHASVNEGVQLARYDYGMSHAADDLLLPHFFAEAMKLFQEEPLLGLVCGDLAFFEDSKPYRLEGYHFLPRKTAQIFSKEETIRLLRKTQFRIESSTTLYNLALFKKYGSYQKELKSLCDHFLNYQIALRHPIGYIPRVCAAYRHLPGSYGSSVSKNKQAKTELFTNFLRKLGEEDREYSKAFKKSNCLAKCGFFVIYFVAKRPQYWSFLPALCWKKLPYLLVRFWHKLKGTKAPRYQLKPFEFSLEDVERRRQQSEPMVRA